MLLFSTRLIPIITFLVALALSAQVVADPIPEQGNSTRAPLLLHILDPESPRVQALLTQAAEESFTADDLLTFLQLDDLDGCASFADRTLLMERHARWSEAVELLALHDPDALHAWLLGLRPPPRIAAAEATAQLECLLGDLIGAHDHPDYSIRLFLSFRDRFGGSISSPSQLADLVEAHPNWRRRAYNALTRSDFRDFASQSYIWLRKHRLEGRPFNRVTPEAGEACRLAPGQTWKPEVPSHQRCWFNTLTAAEREREILTASAAPGLSRHHWGTDVDILGLNHTHFAEGGPLHGDWRWLNRNALDHGYFQPYGPSENPHAHMEERWHWSYLPIAQALHDFIRLNPHHFQTILFERWDHLDRRWGGRRGPYFDHMRQHWQSYVFDIALPDVAGLRPD